MAKIQVVDSKEETRIPFLRGILTRSLSEAGLSFEEAYTVAAHIRQELGDTATVSTDELRQRVADHLKKNGLNNIAEAYTGKGVTEAEIRIRGAEGEVAPFSRSQHLACLESCGLTGEQANGIAEAVIQRLRELGQPEVTSARLGRMTYDLLQAHLGPAVAKRFLVWIDHTHSGRPLLLLIGGATGTGKSTIATEVAHRLGIVRTQSTDLLREVMRMLIPKRLLPVLHRSSFAAWQALRVKKSAGTKSDPDSVIPAGYLWQAELLAVPCEAVIRRALRERVSLILEGIHVHPSLVERIGNTEDAIVVPVMLSVLKQKQLRQHLSGRGLEAPGRKAQNQLANFDAIWGLQTFLLSEADRAGVPILVNEDKEKTTNQVMTTIIDTLTKRFSGTPEGVFGPADA